MTRRMMVTKTNEHGIVGAVPREPRSHSKAAQRKYSEAEARINRLKAQFLREHIEKEGL